MDHKNSQSASYAAAGVDITAGYKAVELMKKHIARTKNEGCLDDVGGFGGCFGLPIAGMEEPVLVSGTDGVGTKLRIAQLLDKHDTIGIDCVAMCVNDVICCGAKPLFFLDYIACGKNVPERIAEIVGGVAEGCVQAGSRPDRRRDRRTSRHDACGRLRSGGFQRGHCGQEKDSSTTPGCARETWSSPWPPPAFTPTDSAWCGRSLMWSTMRA